LFVVSKPAHWPLHPSKKLCLGKDVSRSNTSLNIKSIPFLIDFAKQHMKADVAYPINRLDKPTSGIVVFAKTSEVASLLQQSFQDKSVTVKEYIAVSRGTPLHSHWVETKPLQELIGSGKKKTKIVHLNQQKHILL